MKKNQPIIRTALASVACLFASFTFAQSLTDQEIKTNIVPLDGSLQKLVQLEPKRFEYNTEKYKHLKLKEGNQYGFLAEDVQAVFPGLVSERNISYLFGKNSYRDKSVKTINEAALIPFMVAAIKEQQQAIESLKAEISELKKRPTTTE